MLKFSNLVQNQSGAQRIELHPIDPTFAAVATVWAATYQGVAEMQQWADFICAAVNACRAINPDNPLAAANALADAVAALGGLECYARQLINDLPQKRDWLAPDIENNLKAYADDARKALVALKGGE